jgi:RNA polymerase sigma factor (sigma-70 family)
MSEPLHSGSSLSASAFADLLQMTQAALYAFVRHLTDRGEDARDIVQDVYVEAWRAAQRGSQPFNPEGDAGAMRRWLFHVAYRKGVSFLRHHQVIPWESFDNDDAASVLTPSGQRCSTASFEDQIGESEVLHTALAQLKPDDAACLLLDIVQGYTTGEIAQILEIAPDAARKRLSRAMERLRAAYFAQEIGGNLANLAYQRKRADR